MNDVPPGETLRLGGNLGQRLLEVYPAYIERAPEALRRTFGMSLVQGQDVAQEAFLRVARACLAGRAAPRKHLMAYLLGAAHNLAVSTFRRERVVIVADSVLTQLQDHRMPPPAADLRVLHEVVVPAIEEMAPGSRKRIVELQAKGLEDREIAEALGISLENLRVQRHNAIVELRRRLRRHCRTQRRKNTAVHGKGIR
ncbi:RNA polymerase sigma factor [Streptomyces ficellus]|uniref:Sigma-70 family RNA polymerase sigma factor n=1 Tax=Streptomyces ficellus TaxID=1977088 RepID=A0A6I6F2R1_9ACTN|nr:sigma-70 family RNA polymerase sigma factor [Streptomyces ficellus]QGV76914.1 sigma-70 family RNA polymerase sigma factor [Streptomyces ficellus]